MTSLNQKSSANGEFDAVVSGHRDGHGFLQRLDGEADVYLPPDEMRAVLHGDTVRARIRRLDKRGRPEAHVLDILLRPDQILIGRLLLENGLWLMAPEDKRFGRDILIPSSATANAREGQVVCVQLTEPPSLFGQPVGRVTEVLGEIDDPGMEIEIAVRKFRIPQVFSQSTLDQAANLPDQLRASDFRNRVDLRDVPLVTIDGEDARDFDDAIYCEPHQQGRGKSAFKGWRLLVAIADVSHYVKAQSDLDKDAYERATSVYFPRRVIPMLPEKLSNGLCSLNPAVARLALVCDMLIDETGHTVAYQFYPSVIESHARLTYTEVAAVLQNTRGSEADEHRGILPHLLNLHELFRVLWKARQRRGAVDFETTETQVISDAQGRILSIQPRVRNDAHRIVEEAMLAANVCAADFISQSGHQGLYRVHEGPTPEKREALRNYLRTLGLGLSLSAEPKPSEFQALAAATKDRPDAVQIHTNLLRSMQQAIYTPANSGHFGLAFEAYTHFTSPIRRYPDLLVHRVIKSIILDKTYKHRNPQIDLPVVSGRRRMPEVDQGDSWAVAGLHCSLAERRADEASQDVMAWLKCRFMREHLGEEFQGSVTGVAGHGLYLTLDELYVEGFVHISELGSDFFQYDEVRQELRGQRNGMRFSIGQKLLIQVSRVDLDGRRIEFRLVPRVSSESIPGISGKGSGNPVSTSSEQKSRSSQAALEQIKKADRSRKRDVKSGIKAASATRVKKEANSSEPGVSRRVVKKSRDSRPARKKQ